MNKYIIEVDYFLVKNVRLKRNLITQAAVRDRHVCVHIKFLNE